MRESHFTAFSAFVAVDDFTQERLAPVVGNSLSGIRVVRELDRMIVSDNGTELTSHAVLVRQEENHVE